MPIASDASTGGRAAEIDRDIIAAAAAVSAGRGAPKAPKPGPTSSSIIGPKRSNFVPSADLTRGLDLVRDHPPMMGPVIPQAAGRSEGDYDRMLGLTARTERDEPEPRERKKIELQGDALRGPDHPKNRTDHRNPAARVTRQDSKDVSGRTAQSVDNPTGPKRAGRLEAAKSDRKQQLVDEVLGLDRRVPLDVVDELAMKTGALTTFDEEVYEQPSRAEQVRAEVAEATGLRGQALDMALGYRAGQEQATGRQVNTRAEDEAQMSEAERSFKSGLRATRRGVNSGSRSGNTERLTSSDYAALSPRQKAAVELNAMLLAAAAADKEVGHPATGKPGKTEHAKEYAETVEALFPGEGQTADYAPNTVEVLRNIGWSGTGTDLDDILSGKLLFNAQDIADLGPEREGVAPDASLNTGNKLRDDLQASLVKSFTRARKESVTGENLLKGKQELLGYEDMPGFSTKPGREVVPGVDVNAFIRSGFDLLANSNTEFTPEQILADARQNLTDTEFQSFLNFVDINSRDAKSYRQPLGTNAEQTYFDPVEFRKSIAAALRKER